MASRLGLTVVQTLVAGVGYPFLRDGALGPVLAAQLKQRTWPEHVEIDDYSFGPVAAVHRWQAMSEPFGKVVFFGAVERGRPPGTVRCYHWNEPAPARVTLQERVAEAVTGVIGLDNLLYITREFGVLPDDAVVIEVEPQDQSWGAGFSEPVERAVPEVIRLIEREAANVESRA